MKFPAVKCVNCDGLVSGGDVGRHVGQHYVAGGEMREAAVATVLAIIDVGYWYVAGHHFRPCNGGEDG